MGKKILIYTENYLPSIGGLENNTALLCQSLVLLGFSVTLITPQKNALENAQFKVIETNSFKAFLCEVRKVNLVLINGGVSFKIVLPSIMARKPYMIIYQMATLFRDIRNNSLKTRILNTIRRSLASFAKKNIGVSEYSFLELQKIFGKNKIDLLVNPADPEFATEHLHENYSNMPFQCLFAGRLIEGKGIRLLIEAVHRINSEKEIIHLQVVGDGPEKQYVVDQEKVGFVFYHSPVSKKVLKGWLNSVHLTVIPSSHHIEGSPLIMAESLVMGVPVLASSQPAMAASLKHKTLIFESGNLEDLTNKLSALTNLHSYQIAKTHCENISDQYSYSNYLKQLKYLVDV